MGLKIAAVSCKKETQAAIKLFLNNFTYNNRIMEEVVPSLGVLFFAIEKTLVILGKYCKVDSKHWDVNLLNEMNNLLSG